MENLHDVIAVINAGGLGTRMQGVEASIPKPMIKVLGVPMLEYQIKELKKNGIRKLIITVSYMREKIKEYFKDGSDHGIVIEYFDEIEPLGTAGALKKIEKDLSNDFFLINGDNIYNVNLLEHYKKHVAFVESNGALTTVLTHTNDHMFDSALLISKNHKVIKWLNKEDDGRESSFNEANSGIHIINKNLLQRFPKEDKIDLDRQIIKPLVPEGKLFSVFTTEYIREIGVPQRIKIAEQDIKENKYKC